MLLFKLVVILSFCAFLIIAKNIKIEDQKHSCQITDKSDTSSLVAYDEFQCGKNNNGEYSHEIEFKDGSIHREKGVIENGVFAIRGFFASKAEPNVCFSYKFPIQVRDNF